MPEIDLLTVEVKPPNDSLDGNGAVALHFGPGRLRKPLGAEELSKRSSRFREFAEIDETNAVNTLGCGSHRAHFGIIPLTPPCRSIS